MIWIRIAMRMAQLPWRVAPNGLPAIAGVESRRLTADFDCGGISQQRKQFGADVLHCGLRGIAPAHSRGGTDHPQPWVVPYGIGTQP
jgi:hypothetical protein